MDPAPNEPVVQDASTENPEPVPMQVEAKRPNKRGRGKASAEGGPDLKKAKTEAKTEDKTQKKRIALLYGYCGANFHGSQRNEGYRTVDSVLEKAACEAGVISEENAGSFHKVGWGSCARTDKGVSALGNVTTFKALLLPDLLEKINAKLPADIKAFEWYSVTNSFSAKNKCSSRKYHYVIPTFVFAPSAQHKDKTDQLFKFTQETHDLVTKALSAFNGTNSYHNFTKYVKKQGLHAGTDQAKRVMIELKCGQPFQFNETEYVEITIHGQSFVLNQIRKMIAMVVCTVRDGQGKNVIHACFQKPGKILPVAPALGLFLGRPFYRFYNQRCAPHPQLIFEDSQEAREEFKNTVVLPHILSKAPVEYAEWLADLDKDPLNYDYLLCTTMDEIERKFPQGDPRAERAAAEEREQKENTTANETTAMDDDAA